MDETFIYNGTITAPELNSYTMILPTVNNTVGYDELMSGSVDVVNDGMSQIYNEANGFLPMRLPIALLVLVFVIIKVIKIL